MECFVIQTLKKQCLSLPPSQNLSVKQLSGVFCLFWGVFCFYLLLSPRFNTLYRADLEFIYWCLKSCSQASTQKLPFERLSGDLASLVYLYIPRIYAYIWHFLMNKWITHEIRYWGFPAPTHLDLWIFTSSFKCLLISPFPLQIHIIILLQALYPMVKSSLPGKFQFWV